MSAGKIRLLFFFLLLTVFSVQAQKTKNQLQKEKQQNLEKIKEVEKILNETADKKKNSIGELTALNQRILQQENLINSIKREMNFLDSEIGKNNDIIQALEEDLKKLKQEYAAMLFAAQKANNSVTRLTFLFSAASFDQLIMRLRYMEQYGETRKLQAEQIVQVQEELSGQVKVIQARREEKNKLLNDEVAENNNLTNLKKKQSNLVRELQKEEKKLKRDLEETKKSIAALDKKIDEIIKEEMAREARASRSKEVIALSSSFEENKRKFPWPVESGFVSQKFGRQNHPALKGIVIQNDGINIQTKSGERARAIFDGQVTAIAFTPGIGSTVLINHGDYFTVYTGLKDIAVKKGQKVTTNQELGEIISNADGISELRFRIYRDKTPLDPQTWLKNM
ncbi:MAG: peptidoglycan DD-metalloendopeptidase family protein [Cyclobacteriaceae bacterium]|nr:peptidoglycan DD-metalloendopeptidase family protein [Cyclobacteriaceae bacterium]